MADGEDVHLLDEAGLVGGDELGEGDQGRPQLLPRVRQPHPRALLVGQQSRIMKIQVNRAKYESNHMSQS